RRKAGKRPFRIPHGFRRERLEPRDMPDALDGREPGSAARRDRGLRPTQSAAHPCGPPTGSECPLVLECVTAACTVHGLAIGEVYRGRLTRGERGGCRPSTPRAAWNAQDQTGASVPPPCL